LRGRRHCAAHRRDQGGPLRINDWKEAGLLKPTWVKPLVATVHASVIRKRLGALRADDRQKLGLAIQMLIDADLLRGRE
jgi:mRNA interferase MazF